MTVDSDGELIAARRLHDKRAFLVNALNPDTAPRLAPALRALRAKLLDGQPHSHNALIAEMLRNSDLAVKTADNQLRNAVYCGMVERVGEYERLWDSKERKWSAHDSRLYRLIDWPDA